MKHFSSKMATILVLIALLFSLAGNIYQYSKSRQDPSYSIAGTYCTVDPRKDGSGTYLAIYPGKTAGDMVYHLYTQEKLLSEGTYEQYGEHLYKLIGKDGRIGQSLLLEDIAYVFADGQSIIALDKYDPVPVYICSQDPS